MILTYRYRLLPLKSQHRALERICDGQRVLYNAALQERIDCYSKTGKTRTYIDQCKALTQCRSELPGMGDLPVNLQRWTLKRLDDAFQGFFRRLRACSGKAGFRESWWLFDSSQSEKHNSEMLRLWEAGPEVAGRAHAYVPILRPGDRPGPQRQPEHSPRRDWREGA